MSQREYPEERLQKAIVQHVKLKGVKGLVWYCVPNGVSSSPRTGARMKAMGLQPGVSDLYFLLPSGESRFLEIKSPKGYPTPEQKQFRDAVSANGALWAYTRELEDALDILKGWGVIQ